MTREMEREVRLGIVLYGGVSLAIYENGVAQELFRAVKGEGVYSFIKQLIDSDVVVDIVSGTSAGGINGVLFGYAVANKKDFRASATLWRDDGDILKLLRETGDQPATSLLNSVKYYQKRLKNAFDSMPPYQAPVDGLKTSQRIVSKIQEFDLFVTSTDIDGCVFTVFDEEAHPIDVKEHRQMFMLSYREDRKNAFEPRDSEALAKLCRATSGFPVAFEPVTVKPGSSEDGPLKRWGKLDGRQEIHFMDGGVLNNKPFTSTIDAITRRTADRSVERLLLYVEPDPERFENEETRPVPPPPNVIQSAGNALIGIPGYQSIASDLQAIAAVNDRARLFEEMIANLPAAGPVTDSLVDGAMDDLQFVADDDRRSVWVAARLGQLRDRAVEGILKDKGERRLLRKESKDRTAAKALVKSFDEWTDTPAQATLSSFDVYYRKRRLLRITDTVRSQVSADSLSGSAETRSPETARYRVLWRKLNHQFKLLEELQFALETAIDLAPIPWTYLREGDADSAVARQTWLYAQNVLNAILNIKGVDLKAALAGPENEPAEREERASFRALLQKRIDAAEETDPKTPHPAMNRDNAAGNLLQRCDELERAVLMNFAPGGKQDVATKEYFRFPIIDSLLFPMQRIAGVESLQKIRTTRISPIDSKRGFGNKTLDEKLCGNELGHFGGFLKRSWRANDTMWGRLDTAGELIECLITPDRMKNVSTDCIQAALLMNLEVLFPNSKPAVIEAIRTLAPRLCTDKSVFEDFWNALTQAAQDGIAEEEVPRVITAAIDQHHDWNQFLWETPSPPLFTPEQVWKVSPRRLDSGIAGYAASMMARDLRPPGGWPEFLAKDYHIGSEEWDLDIPTPILIEMAAQAALVLRNCLLDVAGPYADKIRKAPLFKIGISLPLEVTYRFARLQRTRPEFLWVTIAAGFVAAAAVLALDFVFWKVPLASRKHMQWLLWIGGPVALAVFLCFMLFALSRPKKKIPDKA